MAAANRKQTVKGNYPHLIPVRQRLYARPIEDIPAAVHAALDAAIPDDKLKASDKVAVTAGSRGISNIAQILTAAVAGIKRKGGEPFIVPAMGSHGGATAEGQATLLAETFGITEQAMGCPIRSTMEVVELGRTPEHDVPVYVDEHVAKANGILVVNRVKAHTDFSGPHESGLMKMITIGLGKRAQAESVHAHRVWGLRELMPEVARDKLKLAPILGGLADFITKRLHDQIDLHATQVNSLVSAFPLRAVVPVVAKHDQEAIDLALYLLRRKPAEQRRVARIRDTAHLGEMLVSVNLLPQRRDDSDLEVVGDPQPLRFDSRHNLLPDEVHLAQPVTQREG